jgi:pyruvate/2-oxoacid:ferredoxin oxidoreductase beta subunit
LSKSVPLGKIETDEIMTMGTLSCQGCGHAILARMALKALGPKTVIVIVPGCIGITISRNIPLFRTFTVFEGGAALLSGITNGLEIRGIHGMNVVGLIGDGGTVDIGFQGMSAAAERNENILWICFDNAAYMNTGGQRSGSTPRYARTTTTPVSNISRGKRTKQKNVPFILAAHHVPYVATASIAYPSDLIGKINYAKKLKGFKYIHVQSPCPTGWGFNTSKTIQVARLMVQSGLWPLYEITEGGNFKLNIKLKELKPVTEALSLQGRYRHLSEDETSEIQVWANEKWFQLIDLDQKKIPI